mmetsp:Transcript_12174/g.27520  ORF Transcript_12174/g.27520 Transcript_12174/m.27520 type:complete len:216 (-) Transcript_12174:47-694(-)
MSSEPMVTMQENGLPVPKMKASAKFALTVNVVFLVISQVLAWPVYFLGAKGKYDGKIDVVAKNELGWLYLGLWIISLAKDFVSWNAMVTRHAACVMQPNMYGYKVMTASGTPAMPYVLLEMDGEVGRANRAQRGIDNLMEYLALYLAALFAVGYVFPFVAFINICMMVVSRVLYAVTYTKAADARQGPVSLFFLCKAMLDGLVVVIFVEALMKQV